MNNDLLLVLALIFGLFIFEGDGCDFVPQGNGNDVVDPLPIPSPVIPSPIIPRPSPDGADGEVPPAGSSGEDWRPPYLDEDEYDDKYDNEYNGGGNGSESGGNSQTEERVSTTYVRPTQQRTVIYRRPTLLQRIRANRARR